MEWSKSNLSMFKGEVSRGEVYFKRLRLEAMHLHLPGGVGWVGKVRTCLKIVGVNGIYMLMEGEHNCVLRG